MQLYYNGINNQQMMFPQATSHGNILTFTPPGFKQTLNVKFPDQRLAVCEKCKKNFKTRDMCRVRNTHTTAPWTTAYICLTLDDSCTDANGKYIDQPLTVRMVQWQPYCVKQAFDPKTPVCAACKKTNRTRSFCRERHKHRQLPWCTVYVLLSALDAADPSTVVAGPSKPVDHGKTEDEDDEGKELEIKAEAEVKSEVAASPSGVPDEASAAESKTSESLDGISENIRPDDNKKSGDSEEGDDINDIAESRTFLAKVNCRSTSIHWLELAELEGHDSVALTMGHPEQGYAMAHQAVQPVDPNQAQYYHPGMGYAVQHHNALKSQQQYFYQMQQRHQLPYTQHQAAWQAHYSQPHHMPVHGQPPPHHPPMHVPPPGMPHGEVAPASAPVTAGEAAAQQQKRNREMAEGSEQSSPTPPGPPPPPPPPHGQAPHLGQQQHVDPQQQQQQQQQWMAYQHMYPTQVPAMSHPPAHYPPPPPTRQPGEGVSPQGVIIPNNEQAYISPHTPEGNGKTNHETDNKRQRLV